MKSAFLSLILSVALCAADSQLDARIQQLRRELTQERQQRKQEQEELRSHFQGQLDAVGKELARVQAELQPELNDQRQQCQQIEQRRTKDELETDLEKRVTEIEGHIDILEQQIIVLDSQLTATLNQVAAVFNNLAVIQEELSDLGETDVDHIYALEKLKDQVENFEESSVNVTRIEAVEDELNGLNLQLNDLGNHVSTIDEAMDDLDERVSAISNATGTGGKFFFLADLTAIHDCINDVPIVFDRVRYNHGDVYDASRGVFTAPADGLYHFSSQLWVRHHNTMMAVRFFVDGESAAYASPADVTTAESATVTLLADLQLQAGQEVTVEVYNSSYVVGDANDQIESWFGGHLMHY